MKPKKFTWQWLVRKLKPRKPPTLQDYVAHCRHEISRQIDIDLGSQVAYGLFKGLKLLTDGSWSLHDRGPMLLGIYEKEILDYIEQQPTPFDTLINLGGADGYYAVGALVSGRAKKVIVYELDVKSQDIIRKTAQLNQVEDLIDVRGTADSKTFSDLVPELGPRTLVLVDIEGAEYDVLTPASLDLLRKAHVVVEIHLFSDLHRSAYEEFLAACRKTHKVSFLQTANRDLSTFKEVHHYSDNERWLICSEGRPHLMSWVVLEPLDSSY